MCSKATKLEKVDWKDVRNLFQLLNPRAPNVKFHFVPFFNQTSLEILASQSSGLILLVFTVLRIGRLFEYPFTIS